MSLHFVRQQSIMAGTYPGLEEVHLVAFVKTELDCLCEVLSKYRNQEPTSVHTTATTSIGTPSLLMQAEFTSRPPGVTDDEDEDEDEDDDDHGEHGKSKDTASTLMMATTNYTTRWQKTQRQRKKKKANALLCGHLSKLGLGGRWTSRKVTIRHSSLTYSRNLAKPNTLHFSDIISWETFQHTKRHFDTFSTYGLSPSSDITLFVVC